MEKKQREHYINNADFTKIIRDWREKVSQAIADGKPTPRIPEQAGKNIMMICERYSMKHNFRGYPFRDLMISTAIEACIKAFPNFDPEMADYPNPLAYFTRCAHFAFIGVITKEKLSLHTKIKLIQDGHVDFFDTLEVDNTIDSSQKEYLMSFLDKNEHEIEFGFMDKKRPSTKKEKVIESPMDEFLG